jgi:manganese/zinc/iron transport system permease protein
MSGFSATFEQDFWTVTIGVLGNVSCALLGCYLVLRRLSLLGDAISHAVLPGIALAFVFTGTITGLPIVAGAMLVGVLTALLTQSLHSLGRVPEDSSMGVVFTSLFALGVILITRAASHTDLDPGCVLYGNIDIAAIDLVPLGGMWVPRSVPTLAVVFLLTLGFVLLLWKELKVVSFDPALASAMGISAGLVHYLLMGMVAGVTVASFEAVGSVLVIAMLIVPAACAQLLTDRLRWMLVWAAVVAVLSSLVGYLAARRWNTSTAGMMAVVAGVQFGLAVLLAPRHGVLAKVLRNARLGLRIACEDVIAALYRAEEAASLGERPAASVPEPQVHGVVGGLLGRMAVPLLSWRGLVARLGDGRLALSPAGRVQARSLVRSHRLWESYLAAHFELPLDHLHEPAERMEHFLDPVLQEELADALHHPHRDPHGRAIPPSDDPVTG